MTKATFFAVLYRKIDWFLPSQKSTWPCLTTIYCLHWLDVFSKSYKKDKHKENYNTVYKITTTLRGLNGGRKMSVGVVYVYVVYVQKNIRVSSVPSGAPNEDIVPTI